MNDLKIEVYTIYYHILSEIPNDGSLQVPPPRFIEFDAVDSKDALEQLKGMIGDYSLISIDKKILKEYKDRTQQKMVCFNKELGDLIKSKGLNFSGITFDLWLKHLQSLGYLDSNYNIVD